MSNVLNMINALGGAAAVAAKLNLRPNTPFVWSHRGRIPRAAWVDIMIAYPMVTIGDLIATEAVEKE